MRVTNGKRQLIHTEGATNENDLSPKASAVQTRGETMVSESLDERSCLEGTLYKCNRSQRYCGPVPVGDH